MKKRQVTRPEPATFRSTADPLAAESRLQFPLSTIVWVCSIQSAMLLTVSPCTPSPRRVHCCAVCQFCTGVHCTDDSPRRLKQPLSADVVFAVLHTCSYTLTLSADVVSAVSSHAHGTLTLSADVVSAVLYTCTYTLTLSADVVSAVSSHAHGTLTLSADVVSAVLHTCTWHVSLCII